jgi:Protein of unknown function (DUF3313)
MAKTEGAAMPKRTEIRLFLVRCSAALLLVSACSCSRQPEAAVGVKQIPQGKEFSGFLHDYSKLKPNPNFENTLSYVNNDPVKNIHQYIAIIVDPVEVYVASNADPKAIPDRGRAALAEYFQSAITRAVEDAFPVVKEPGPLVLRLRSAIIGIDVGPGNSTDTKTSDGALERAVNIGKVGVEMELVDSQTGEQIAAAVDHQDLGDGAMVGSVNFSRDEKYRSATQAFDGWAARLRQFLDSAEELSPEDSAKVDRSYRPYGEK